MSEVYRPVCLEELFACMARVPEFHLLAGGTDLLVRRRKVADDRPLLVLERVKELQQISAIGAKISIGAAVSFARIADHPLVLAHVPLLSRACLTIGGPALRNMATIGGNIVSASPAADSLPPLYLSDAELELVSAQGSRLISISDFIQGPGKTALQSGEIVASIRLSRQKAGAVIAFEKIGLRKSLAIAVASFAGMVNFSADGSVAEARFAWGSVAPTVARFTDLEAQLAGKRLDQTVIGELSHAVKRMVSPIADIRASAEYRRAVAGNMLVRFLEGVG